MCKRYYFCLLFLTVHISINFAHGGPRFDMHVSNIHVKETVSQIIYLGNKQVIFFFFFFLLYFLKHEPGPLSKI